MKDKINEKKSLLREGEKIQKKENAEKKVVVHERRHHSMLSGIFTKIIIILLLLIILLGAGYYVFTVKMAPEVQKTNVVVMDELLACQELVTMKYKYSDIVSVKKSLALSKSYSIVKFSGIIRAGIGDLNDCDIEVSDDNKTLRIKLPDIEILGNDITSQEVFDESHSIFVPITLDEVFAEIERSKEETLDEIIEEGLLDDARNYAKTIIQQMMKSAGFETVIVV